MRGRTPRPVVPDTRLIETPKGTLALRFGWMKSTGIDAMLELYGPDGWKSDRRFWMEKHDAMPGQSRATLPQVVSEWTGMPRADAEVCVTESVEQWRGSSAFASDVQINRWTKPTLGALVMIVALALAGLAALVWLILSALT
jgi:hypothetical protein